MLLMFLVVKQIKKMKLWHRGMETNVSEFKTVSTRSKNLRTELNRSRNPYMFFNRGL